MSKFEYQLLSLSGYAPDFLNSGANQPIRAEERYCLTREEGFELRSTYANEGSTESSFEGTTLQRFAHDWFAQQQDLNGSDEAFRNTYREAKKLMRQLIDRALLSRGLKSSELKTRELFKQIKRG